MVHDGGWSMVHDGGWSTSGLVNSCELSPVFIWWLATFAQEQTFCLHEKPDDVDDVVTCINIIFYSVVKSYLLYPRVEEVFSSVVHYLV